MNKKFISVLCVTLLFVGCANKQQSVKESKVDRELKLMVGDDIKYTDLEDEDKLIRDLLKNSPSFAQENQQSAVKENIEKLPNNMPLFRQPLFAQMVVFPYVSDDGVYHGYSENWLKIKEGEFVLSDPRSGQELGERIFDMNDVGIK